MDYSNCEITVLNIPQLESLGNKQCCRRYLYQFINLLPDLNELNSLVKKLDYKFTFSKDIYELPQDVDVYAWLTLERLSDREVMFTASTDEPEESVIYLYGLYSLPGKIEKIFGSISSIQGDSRELWIKANRNNER
jgi:hypothetical protein